MRKRWVRGLIGATSSAGMRCSLRASGVIRPRLRHPDRGGHRHGASGRRTCQPDHAELASLANSSHPTRRSRSTAVTSTPPAAATPMFATAFRPQRLTGSPCRGPDIDTGGACSPTVPSPCWPPPARVARAPQADATVTGAATRELAYDAPLCASRTVALGGKETPGRDWPGRRNSRRVREDIFYLTTEGRWCTGRRRLRIKRRAAERERLRALVLPR